MINPRKEVPVLRAADGAGIVTGVNFGDLHMTDREQDNVRDFRALIGEVNAHMSDSISFVYLRGNNADHGTEEEYELVRAALDGLRLPPIIWRSRRQFVVSALRNCTYRNDPRRVSSPIKPSFSCPLLLRRQSRSETKSACPFQSLMRSGRKYSSLKVPRPDRAATFTKRPLDTSVSSSRTNEINTSSRLRFIREVLAPVRSVCRPKSCAITSTTCPMQPTPWRVPPYMRSCGFVPARHHVNWAWHSSCVFLNSDPRTLQVKDAWRILDALSQPYRTIVPIAFCFGLRISEILGLRWTDFDFKRSAVLIQRSSVSKPLNRLKTECSQDEVPLERGFIVELKKWQELCLESEGQWLFPSPVTGRPLHADSIRPTISFQRVCNWGLGGSGSTRSATPIVRGWTKPELPWVCSRSSCDTHTFPPRWTSTAMLRWKPSAKPIGLSCNDS